MEVKKVIRSRNILNAINCLGMASYSIRLFCDLPLDNKLGSQVCKGKHQRTGDSTCLIVIYTCFPLINPCKVLNSDVVLSPENN